MWLLFRIVLVAVCMSHVEGFTASSGRIMFGRTTRTTRTSMAAAAEANNDNVVSLELTKPLGIILEEVEEGAKSGVKVEELSDAGSAYAHRDVLVKGSVLVSVMEQDVSQMDFDDVMDVLMEAPSPLKVEFTTPPPMTDYDVGTIVTLNVLQGNGNNNNPTPIQAKVGDNLRQVLLDNKFEVYKGLKQRLGNCGGAGQCTYCAVNIVDGDGWPDRSEYENNKLKKMPNARLACINPIQGPATIEME